MINEANPLWQAIGSLNRYIGSIQAVLQNSANVVPLAVYLADSTYFHGIEPAATDALLEHVLDNGYDYDRINDDSIMKSHVADRALVTPGGAKYAALVLPARPALPAKSAAQLARFAEAGLPVFFADRPPIQTTGFFDHAAQDGIVRDAVQSALNAGARIVRADALAGALRHAGVPANLTFTGAPCLFIQKTLEGRAAYFLHNPKTQAVTVGFTTHAAGHPERWNAYTGERTGLQTRSRGGQTEITVDLAAGAGAMIVFGDRRLPPPATWTQVDAIDLTAGRWTVDVDGHGRHGRVVRRTMALDRLCDWQEIEGLGDVSGQATYRIDVSVPAAWFEPGNKVVLDLGAVHDMAIVTVPGRQQATLIAPPFEADVTAMLRPGANELQIGTFNSPNNAMIDPKKPGLKSLKPQPAGLVGPVKLVLKQRRPTAA
jgi:hypothetical protein